MVVNDCVSASMPSRESGFSGRFITFEGGEGAGKSTQIKRLKTFLETQGKAVLATREPGGSPGAESIRGLLVRGETDRWDAISELLLFNAARRDHVMKTILPALKGGMWVLCDRFVDSTVAIQGYGHGLNLAFLSHLHALVTEGLRPDMTFLIDVPAAEGLRRSSFRERQKQQATSDAIIEKEDRIERLGLAFHEKLRQGYLKIAQQAQYPYVVLEGQKSPTELAQDIEAEMFRYFPDLGQESQ